MKKTKLEDPKSPRKGDSMAGDLFRGWDYPQVIGFAGSRSELPEDKVLQVANGLREGACPFVLVLGTGYWARANGHGLMGNGLLCA